jgi:ribonuclease R
MTMSHLAASLGAGKGERDLLRAFVQSLVDEGLVERLGRRLVATGNRRQSASPEGPYAVGQIRVHPAGYGFVQREDGFGDVFVPARYRGHAIDGDRVQLYTWEGYKGTEGRVEEVLARGRAKLTGTLRKAGRFVYVEPDDPRIASDHGRVSLEEGAQGVAIGQCVLIEITQYPDDSLAQMVGRIVRVLGDPEDPRTEIEKIIACGDIPNEFPEDALTQAKRTSQEVSQDDLADRIDLRDRSFLTIDPETARDFDDALCFEEGPHGGPRVWIAVADVSHYVRQGDALDQEARIRGVSVYFPDRVVPMLPLELSSGICSLNPEVDRCAMVVRLDFDEDAKVVDSGFAAAVIRSQARLDYPGVAAALSGDFRGSRGRYRRWAAALERLHGLSQKLRSRRRQRGTLEMELAEAKVILDADDPRLVRDVVRAKGSESVKGAYQLVEEFMIAANEAVGSFFEDRGATALWRVHAPPDESRLEELAETLATFDIKVDVEAASHPRGMVKVLDQLRGHDAEQALTFLVLRSLKQAIYDTANVGHFGLASKRYIHFTSPIRRYPDLIVHRLMKHYLHREGQAAGSTTSTAKPLPRDELGAIAAEVSGHERRAVEAEREAVSMYRAYLMRQHVGETFSAKVSGVTNFGIFVELDEPFVEALIKLDSLGDDRYDFDPETLEVRARRSGHVIRLGTRMKVEVVGSSVIGRKVEVRVVGQPSTRTASRPPKARGPKVRPRKKPKLGRKPKKMAGKRRPGKSKGRKRR